MEALTVAMASSYRIRGRTTRTRLGGRHTSPLTVVIFHSGVSGYHCPVAVADVRMHGREKPLALNLLRLFTSQAGSDDVSSQKPFIAFVLGGPGSGKGTQCSRIASNYGFVHLSAGDLLRHEISSSSEKGELILEIIKEGRIVPSEITVELIRKAMESSNAKRVLIDGFPRCEENRIAFERIVGSEPDLVIFFDCPKDEMVKRLLGRNQGRVDDNIETIKKRLKVFESLNIPVVDYYSSRGKAHKINAMGTADEIFEAVRKLFSSLRL